MKPYGGRTPLSHMTCPACAQHDREKHKANKHGERFRAASDVASGVGYVGGEYWLDWDDPPVCDETCEICHGADAVRLDGFPLPPLTHTLSVAA